MAYTDTWNSSFEGVPADTEDISQGADRIRELKVAIRERMQKDHYWDTSGTDADHGEHKWVTLREQVSKPAVGSGKHALYAKSDGIYVEKEDGTEIKLLDFDSGSMPTAGDADTVDGKHASDLAYNDLSNVDDDNILTKLKEVDGSGSGLDADLIRGWAGDFSHAYSGTGYQKIPGGLIIQWGSGTVSGNSSESVSFNIPFPTAALVVVSVPIGSSNGGGSEDYWGVSNLTVNGFTQHNGYDGAQSFYYIALGH